MTGGRTNVWGRVSLRFSDWDFKAASLERLDVSVAERPVFSEAVEGGGLEIPIAEAQADAAPNIGAATGHAEAAHPVKGLVRPALYKALPDR